MAEPCGKVNHADIDAAMRGLLSFPALLSESWERSRKMGGEERHKQIAEVSLAPPQARCGESIVLRLALRLGVRGLSPENLLVIDCPGYLGSSRPQFLYQEEEGFVTVNIADVADASPVENGLTTTVSPEIPWRGAVATPDRAKWLRSVEDYQGLAEKARRPYRLICLQFPLGLRGGTQLVVSLGAGGGGFSPGYKVGVVAPRPSFPYRFLVQVYETADAAMPVEEHAAVLEVHPAAPQSGRIVRGATGRTRLIFSDPFGNPSPVADLNSCVSVEGGAFVRNDHGVHESRAERLRIRATGSVPVADSAPMQDVFARYAVFWGDLHTHSGLSCDCKRNERSELRPADLLRFARDGAALDFLAVTDHHVPDTASKMLSEAEWEETVAAVESATRPGEFVAIVGYEHRGPRGDTVAIFAEAPTFAEISDPATVSVEYLWAALRHRGILTVPHFHDPGRLPDGEWIVPPDMRYEPVLEVFSCHGRFDVPRYEGMALAPPLIKLLRGDRNAAFLLQHGYRYGLICSSDDHKGRPGINGLVAVYARELTRAAIFEALRQRRCYGTTNARIRLVFALGDVLMGGQVAPVSPARAQLRVVGTAPLRCVDVIRNGHLHLRFQPQKPVLEVEWDERLDEKEAYYWVRVLQEDQEMAFSSPIWTGTTMCSEP